MIICYSFFPAIFWICSWKYKGSYEILLISWTGSFYLSRSLFFAVNFYMFKLNLSSKPLSTSIPFTSWGWYLDGKIVTLRRLGYLKRPNCIQYLVWFDWWTAQVLTLSVSYHSTFKQVLFCCKYDDCRTPVFSGIGTLRRSYPYISFILVAY